MINLLPTKVADEIAKIPPDIWELEPIDLMKKFENTNTLRNLRFSFWREYDHSSHQKAKMKLVDVFRESMTARAFYRWVLTNPYKMAYILTPPMAYNNKLDYLVKHSMDRLVEVLDMPLYTNKVLETFHEDGSVKSRITEKIPSAAMAKVVLDVFRVVDERQNGLAIQRIETKNETKTLNITKKMGPEEQLPFDIGKLQARLDELKLKTKSMKNLPPNPKVKDG